MILRLKQCLLTACCLAAFAMPTLAGKPPGGGGTTPPPPSDPAPPVATDLPNVVFKLTWLPVGISATNINNFGDVVGRNSNEMYYAFDGSNPGASIVLNALGSPWYDLNATTPHTLSTGWTPFLYGARINDNGDVIGTATKRRSQRRVFVLQNVFNRDSRPRRFLLLPTISSAHYRAWDINKWGVVVAAEEDSDLGVVQYTPNKPEWPYYTTKLAIAGTGNSNVAINDFGVIVNRSIASSLRLTPGAGANGTDLIDFFPEVELLGISNNYISGRNSYVNAAGPMRLPIMGTSSDVQVIWPNNSRSWDVNDRGHTIFEASVNSLSRVYLYSDAINPKTVTAENPNGLKYGNGGNGILPLDQMVVNPDTAWLTKHTHPYYINNEFNMSGFGQICGNVFDIEYNAATVRGFVLTPAVPVP